MKKIKDVTSLLDSTASFEMSLSHDNIPVKWMFRGAELKSSENCKIVSERKAHKLTLQNVDSSHAGEYTAVVGHLQCSAVLTVEGWCQKSLFRRTAIKYNINVFINLVLFLVVFISILSEAYNIKKE